MTRSRGVRGGSGDGWRRVFAVPVVLALSLPVVVMVLGALKPAGVPPSQTIELPTLPLEWSNFSQAAELVDLPHAMGNSLLVVAVLVPGAVLVASWAGLAIARMRPRRRNAWIAVAFVAAVIPVSFLILGRFFLFRRMEITGTLLPLMMPALIGGSPLFVVLYVWAFRRIPSEVLDAAEVEGASPLAIWWRVAMPLVKPVTVAVAMLVFLLSWGDFIGPLIYLSNPDTFTVPLALRVLSGVDTVNTPWMLAGALLATIPAVLGFAVAQRSLVRLSGGAGGRA